MRSVAGSIGIDSQETGDSTSNWNVSDSNVQEALDEKHERNREHRIEAVKRWVAYLKSEPPAVWGPQQNAVVNDQIDAAQSVGTSAQHQQHVKDVAADIAAIQDDNADANE